MPRRIIIDIPANAYAPPENAVLASGHVDYITAEEPPADALYVGEMDELGQVALVKAAPEGFVHEHTFAGWPPVYRI